MAKEMNRRILAVLFIFAMASHSLYAHSGGGHSSHKSSSRHPYVASHRSYAHASGTGHRSTYSTVAPRDSLGHIKRSASAKRIFEKETGHPHGWKGHVVDHVVPLKRGGEDAPSNMQWQTIEDAKAKDRIE